MTDFPPTHPGEVLREDFLKPLGLSQYRLAKVLGVPAAALPLSTAALPARPPITILSKVRGLSGRPLS